MSNLGPLSVSVFFRTRICRLKYECANTLISSEIVQYRSSFELRQKSRTRIFLVGKNNKENNKEKYIRIRIKIIIESLVKKELNYVHLITLMIALLVLLKVKL